MTVADLPVWLPSWEVLLTLSLSLYLIMQIVSAVMMIFMLIVARHDLEMLQPISSFVTFLVLIAIIVTARVVG